MESREWHQVIVPKRSFLQIDLKEIWRYRDLVSLFVRRDFVANYKQTIMGPLWFFIQPLLTTLIFVVIFFRVAGLSTDGVPPILFYLGGLALWNYFSDCFTKTADTFKANEQIFGKVYFPRLVVPISIVLSNLVKFGIQFLLFAVAYIYFISTGAEVAPNLYALLFPAIVLVMALFSLGCGLIISSLTTKYRDLYYLLTFGVQLLMYATPVIYPISMVSEKYRGLLMLNPLSSMIEAFKFGFLGQGYFSWFYLGYSLLVTVFVLLFGVLIFNRTEQNFMDTI
jgi:lipopolysaccharide transport system permease protein